MTESAKLFDPTGTLHILGYAFTVETNAGLAAKQQCGHIEEHHQLIQVGEGLGLDSTKESVLHEILHAVEFATGANLTERQVTGVARGLYAVCKDNPEYMKRLLFG